MNPVCHCLGIIVTNLLQIYLNKFIFCVTLRWMDGSQLLFQSWQENQPDFKNFDENCAFMTYHNGECTEIRFSFTEVVSPSDSTQAILSQLSLQFYWHPSFITVIRILYSPYTHIKEQQKYRHPRNTTIRKYKLS